MLSTDSFLDYLQYERNYSENTVARYREDIEQFCEFIQKKNGGIAPEEADAKVIRKWVISLMEKYAASSVNRKLSSLHSYYRFLLRRGDVLVDPLRKVVRPKNKKTLPTFVREEDMNRLLDEVDFGDDYKGCRDRMIILMFYATGIRLSELIGLDDADVDMNASLIKVTGKRNKQRLIPFAAELKEELINYVDKRNREVPNRMNSFFVREDGRPLCATVVRNMVKQNLSKVTTAKKRSPHVLRHSFATAMLNNQAELGAIKELLGHESLATTEIYTHTTFEELKKVYNQAHPRA
ncbi:MAG: tyrosine recombinase XerC [Mediterranea massiliensis]|nr:tyrosine recombinase XerC [Mediterranea massiliensis]